MPWFTKFTLEAKMSPFSSSEAPAAMMRLVPGVVELTVAALLPFKSSVTDPAGSVRLLAKFRVGVLVRLSVPVLAKIVPEPKEVMPPSIVSF